MTIINFENISTLLDDADALTTDTLGELVINFGDLTTTGNLADGFFAEATDVSFRNFGAIETSGLGAAGIFVQGENARIENFGSVHTTGDFFGDFEFFSEGIFASGDGFYIANHGSIQVEGESSSALVGAGADGLIVNFGVAESSATESAVIAAFGARSQAINMGQVTSSGGSTGAMVVNGEGEDASALNLGEILVTGAASNGMAGDANSQLTNRGVIHFTLDDSFGDPSFGMISIVGGSQLSNFGLIEMHGALAHGISALGRIPLGELGLDFEIVNAGRITTDGDLAVGVALGLGRFGFANAADGQIENRGVIETLGDGAAGVLMIGNSHHLTNSGQITTNGGTFTGPPVGELHAAGVIVSGDDALVDNTRKGVIESENANSAAVELNVLERDGLSNADTSSTVENFGLIRGAVAVLGGDGEETVINHGRIVGDVDLGAGDDIFVFGKGGRLVGDLVLGAGSDLVRVEDRSGTSRIEDFVAGALTEDVIDVSAFFTSFDDLFANGNDSGGDVIVSLDANDALVLVGVSKTDLHGDDFFFA